MSIPASPASDPPPSRPGAARVAHACCFVVAVLVTGHAAFAVALIVLFDPYPEMEGPSVFVAYIFMVTILVWLVSEAAGLWLVVVIAVRAYPRGAPAVVVVLCGATLLHGLFVLHLVGSPGSATPLGYTLAHVAVMVLAVVTIPLLVAAHRTRLPSTPPG